MHYMTADDKTRLEEQLKELSSLRKVLSDRIGRARELGDLKENAEYHAAKEDQGLNERKIKELERKLASAIVTDDQTVPEDMVFIGATVKLKDVAN
ncbi:MAG: GreA/GreB family elongation factor, partial [Planctomycetota bacterium]